ncbi:MAG: hypothetical protein JW991_03400 [Candidatus Pacebacteria bacterium]|nr:hypothetical protein [Candidatus Paceibacterota bacterium]
MTPPVRKIISTILSSLLILFGVYNLIFSVILIFFVYPQVFDSPRLLGPALQESLIEKAITIYLSTVIDGFYGVALFLKPSEKIKIIHLVAAFLIFVYSVFFVTQSNLTRNPLGLLFSLYFKK